MPSGHFHGPECYTWVYCPTEDDVVMARHGFCSVCGETDHDEVDITPPSK
jgi:hypothetical protein